MKNEPHRMRHGINDAVRTSPHPRPCAFYQCRAGYNPPGVAQQHIQGVFAGTRCNLLIWQPCTKIASLRSAT